MMIVFVALPPAPRLRWTSRLGTPEGAANVEGRVVQGMG